MGSGDKWPRRAEKRRVDILDLANAAPQGGLEDDECFVSIKVRPPVGGRAIIKGGEGGRIRSGRVGLFRGAARCRRAYRWRQLERRVVGVPARGRHGRHRWWGSVDVVVGGGGGVACM